MTKTKLFAAIASLFICGSLSTYAIVSDSEKNPSEWSITTYKKCYTCEGKGYVIVKDTHSSCSGYGCAACDYRGYLESRQSCSTCDGTGRIKTTTQH